MRQKTANDKNEQVEVLGLDEHVVELPEVNDAARSVLVADATAREVEIAPTPPPEIVPEVKRYVVTKGGSILNNGFRVTLKEGKEIDSLNYDIVHVQRQGIRLQRAETYQPEIID